MNEDTYTDLDACRLSTGCPARDRDWGNLIAVIESGKPVKKPVQIRLIHAAGRYMRHQYELWYAAAAWYDAVVSDLDDTAERAHLLAVIRKFL